MPSPTVGTRQTSVQVTLHRAYGVTEMPRWASGYRSVRVDGVPGEVLTKSPGDSWAAEPLEGQEFLRLAACRTVAQAADFIRGFGDLGLSAACEALMSPSGGATTRVPLLPCVAVQWLSGRDQLGANAANLEYPEDIQRFAGLLRAAVDAYRVASEPSYSRRARLRWGPLFTQGHRRISLASDADTPVVGGLLQAGFRIQARAAVRRSFRLSFPPAQELLARTLDTTAVRLRPSPEDVVIESPTHLLAFVAELLGPGVSLARRHVAVVGRHLDVGTTAAGADGLVVLHLEAAEAFSAQAAIHECAWHRCPGAPQRQSMFLFRSQRVGERDGDSWSWLRTGPNRERRRTGIYCSRLCASAAATHASRTSRRGRARSVADADRRRARRNG
jgi:hypothetical protein